MEGTRFYLAILVAVSICGILETTSATTEYVVGDDLGWVVPPGGPVAYTAWAYNKTFLVGDTLVFNFVNGSEDVATVTKEEYQDCDQDIDTEDVITVFKTSPVKFVLNATGEYFFTSTYQRHCFLGQKLAINVTNGTAPPPPPPPPPPAPAPPRGPLTYTVGDNLTWIVPPGGSIAYVAWAYNKTFIVGDTLVFNFENGTQDVAIVTKEDYQECDTDADNIIALYTNSPVNILLNATGEHFFTSTYKNHCIWGQKLAINVTAATTTAPPPTSSTPTPTTPSTPSSPSPQNSETAAPPVSSAPLKLFATLFLTFLSVFLGLFY